MEVKKILRSLPPFKMNADPAKFRAMLAESAKIIALIESRLVVPSRLKREGK